jgi:hypothetical protein
MYGDNGFDWSGSIYSNGMGFSVGNPESRSAADYLEYFPTSGESMPSSGNALASTGYNIPQISLTPYGSSSASGGYGTGSVSSGGQRGSSLTYIPPTLTGKTETTPMLSGRTTTTNYIGGGTLPTYAQPTYEHPEYDYGRINYLAQQQAAPQYTRLQQGLYAGIGKVASTDNPQLQRMARKDLLSGYGGGVSDIAAKSAQTGIQLYAPEYAGKLTEASMNYQGGLAKAQADFSALMAEYEKSFTQQTTEALTYTPQTSSTSMLYNDTNALGGGDTKSQLMNLYGLSAYDAEQRILQAGRSAGYVSKW